jgi:D-sedoheptulose 7-phosphate isomerase
VTLEKIRHTFAEAARNLALLADVAPQLLRAAEIVAERLRAGGTVFLCGNGGSAADAEHLAAEFQGRFLAEREPLPAIALSANSSAMTAIANDYGYEEVFARQLRGLAKANDVLIAISTGGNSRNVIRALSVARDLGIPTIGLSGKNESAMTPLCDPCIRVPSTATPRIQEMHILVGHTICELVEAALASPG